MASKGTSPPGIPGRSTPAHPMATRATSKADTQQTSSSPQPAKTGQKSANRNAARAHLASEGCLSDENQTVHTALVQSLILIIKKYTRTSPPAFIKSLEAFGLLLQDSKEMATPQLPALEAITTKIGEIITHSVQKGISELSVTLKSSLAEQNKLQDTAVALDAAANIRNSNHLQGGAPEHKHLPTPGTPPHGNRCPVPHRPRSQFAHRSGKESEADSPGLRNRRRTVLKHP
ncbi:hypothetical protein EDB84DRAFT_1446639 [Lactarius hengduanensis]|nr:hypothetical protein EDB84DRAFT_1446639 [Lactarius hengduanensis]